MKNPQVIIIGGGAAGMMAAGTAAETGAETLLLEKMKQTGLKLGITGKGRCNLTNSAELSEFIEHFGQSGKFLRQAFHQFFNTELMDFFTSKGLQLTTERGGRVFPTNGKAGAVRAIFKKWHEDNRVMIRYSTDVQQLLIKDNQITGVKTNKEIINCTKVILTTGGASYPQTGSTGDGYNFAQSAGHTIIPIRPALVPLVCAKNATSQMADLHLKNIRASLFINNKKQSEEFGELIFTKFGVTGPIVLTLSGLAIDALLDKKNVVLSLDLKPALDLKKLEARLLRDITKRCKETISSLLRGLLPREMIPVCLHLLAIDPNKMVHSITSKERRAIRTWLKDFRLPVTGHRPLTEAIVTAGGIDTREVNPKTMESKIINGLYIAGELLDIQGDTGGYNLQAAFSTGWVAGKHAAKV